MDESLPTPFSRSELLSYLPTGWRLAEPGASGSWDKRRRLWTLAVCDGAETEWKLAIRADRLESAGRLGALKEAMDRLFRDALG